MTACTIFSPWEHNKVLTDWSELPLLLPTIGQKPITQKIPLGFESGISFFLFLFVNN